MALVTASNATMKASITVAHRHTSASRQEGLDKHPRHPNAREHRAAPASSGKRPAQSTWSLFTAPSTPASTWLCRYWSAWSSFSGLSVPLDPATWRCTCFTPGFSNNTLGRGGRQGVS